MPALEHATLRFSTERAVAETLKQMVCDGAVEPAIGPGPSFEALLHLLIGLLRAWRLDEWHVGWNGRGLILRQVQRIERWNIRARLGGRIIRRRQRGNVRFWHIGHEPLIHRFQEKR
jgi:hypothetical protein